MHSILASEELTERRRPERHRLLFFPGQLGRPNWQYASAGRLSAGLLQ